MSPKRSGEGIPVFVPAAETRTPRSQSAQPVNNSPRALGFGGDGGREMPADAFALVARFFFAESGELENEAFSSRERGVPASALFSGRFRKTHEDKNRIASCRARGRLLRRSRGNDEHVVGALCGTAH